MPTTAPDAPAARPEVAVSTVVAVGADLVAARQVLTSARRHAELAHEVVAVVDGTSAAARELAEELADRTVTVEGRPGLGTAWNRGLGHARGRHVAFCAPAAVLPPGWDRALVDAASSNPTAAVVVPEVVDGPTGRPDPGEVAGAPAPLAPFSPAPPPVVYLLPADLARELGPWDEGYLDGSGAEADLCFTVWANDLDVVVDHRVVVRRFGTEPAEAPSASARSAASRRFRDRWQGEAPVTRLASCPPERFERNRATARAVARWMDRDAAARDDDTARMRRQLRAMGAVNRQLQAQVERPATRLERTARGVMGPSARKAVNRLSPATVRRVRQALNALPPPVEAKVRRLARRLGVSRGPVAPS